VGVLFLLCPWFPTGFFTRLQVLRRHPGILGFLFLLLFSALHRSVFFWSFLSFFGFHASSSEGKCQNETSGDDGRSSGSERWKARSVGALGDGSNRRIGSPSSSGLYPVPLGPGVCMETLYIDDLLAGKEDCIGYTITVLSHYFDRKSERPLRRPIDKT